MNDPYLRVLSPEEPRIEHRVFLRSNSVRFERHQGAEMIGSYELYLPYPNLAQTAYQVSLSKEEFTIQPKFTGKGQATRFFAGVLEFFQKFSTHAGKQIYWTPSSVHPGMRKILERNRFGDEGQKHVDYERLIGPNEAENIATTDRERDFFDRLLAKIRSLHAPSAWVKPLPNGD